MIMIYAFSILLLLWVLGTASGALPFSGTPFGFASSVFLSLILLYYGSPIVSLVFAIFFAGLFSILGGIHIEVLIAAFIGAFLLEKILLRFYFKQRTPFVDVLSVLAGGVFFFILLIAFSPIFSFLGMSESEISFGIIWPEMLALFPLAVLFLGALVLISNHTKYGSLR